MRYWNPDAKYFDGGKFPYFGIWHPSISHRLYSLWRRFMCRRHYHLFDEVSSSNNGWYLVCDACDLIVHIDRVETTYCEEHGIHPYTDD
jgi:hypothetical protein